MKRFWSLILVVAVGGTLVSCGAEKTEATNAIKAAEAAWAPARDNAMKVVPDEAKRIDDAIASAKATLDRGDAKGALAAAKDLPAQIQQLTAELPAKETELRNSWGSMSGGIPGVLAAAQKRMDILSKSKSLPAGMDAATFDGAKSSLAQASQQWAEAQSAQQSGNLADAVAKASGAKQLLTQVLTALKMPVPPALQT
jgi:hypothetical protein